MGSCGLSCGFIGGMEGFTNSEYAPVLSESSEKSQCPAKDMMGSCLYTTQGLFICNKKENEVSGVAKNQEMFKEPFRLERPFAEAAPWNQN